MQQFEYKVVPAPVKGTKAKGVKGPEGRFANSIEALLNEMAVQGWEFQRAELLPSEERAGLTGSATNWRNVLVFRRPVDQGVPVIVATAAETEATKAADTPTEVPAATAQPVAPVVAPPVGAANDDDVSGSNAPAVTIEVDDGEGVIPHSVPGPGAVAMLKDDGVEEVSPVAGMTTALKVRAAQKKTEDD
ncbi:DUF4177 domain-containing protein [Aliisedimentitalea scapharcae]|uniref:DUF4177 domain-containing protein n=1 Tax=Aliisedimentitalea scapharcae TaxID=1524259 RepID=A0ABZ2XSQ1_9RHOB